MSLDDLILQAIGMIPDVIPHLDKNVVERLQFKQRLQAYKSAPLSRDEIEKRLTRSIAEVEKRYLQVITDGNGQIPFDYWRNYEAELAQAIASPIRAQIEQSFAESSEHTAIIDKTEATAKIDAAVTATILLIAQKVTQTTRTQYTTLLQEGVTGETLIERLALRFSSGHAEQIAVTELTRAEGEFSNVLSQMLGEMGLNTQIRLNTSEDERVCPICGPADGKLKDQPITTTRGGWNGQTWGARFGNPPFHTNCRCKTNVELKR